MRLLCIHSVIESLLHFLLNYRQHTKNSGFELSELIPGDAWIREIRDQGRQYFIAEDVAGKRGAEGFVDGIDDGVYKGVGACLSCTLEGWQHTETHCLPIDDLQNTIKTTKRILSDLNRRILQQTQ